MNDIVTRAERGDGAGAAAALALLRREDRTRYTDVMAELKARGLLPLRVKNKRERHKESTMKWTRHKGGLHRAEDGHVIAKRGPDSFELRTPEGDTHAFTSLEDAQAFVEGGDDAPEPVQPPEPEPEPEEKKQPAKKAAKKTAKKTAAKKATAGKRDGDGDLKEKKVTGVDGRLVRMAEIAEKHDENDFAAALRERVGRKPAKKWATDLPELISDGCDAKLRKQLEAFAGRFADFEDEELDKKLYAPIFRANKL